MIIAAIESHLETLRPSELLVAHFLLGRPSVVVNMSIADLAEQCAVSEPTIMRFCKAIGCLGFMELKLALARDLERRTFTMSRANPAVKGPTGFGQAVFARVVENLGEMGSALHLDRIDEVLEYCAASRAINVLHDPQEASYAQALVHALLACHLEAKAVTQLPTGVRLDGRVVLALRSAATMDGRDAFFDAVMAHEGRVVLVGFTNAPNSLALCADAAGNSAAARADMSYLALIETLRLSIEARLSRKGSLADTAIDFLQSQREIAYGDARRRDRRSAAAILEQASVRGNEERV